MILKRISGESGLILLLACSLVLNVALMRRNANLVDRVERVKNEGRLSPGASVPAISAHDQAGQLVKVSVTGTALPTLVYVFSPTCGWCAKNIENLKTLGSGMKGKYNVLGLSLTSEHLAEYIKSNALTFPVYSDPMPTVVSAYHLGGTPQTIVISPDGKVVKSWYGAYVGPAQVEVETFFAIHLPGLINPPSHSAP